MWVGAHACAGVTLGRTGHLDCGFCVCCLDQVLGPRRLTAASYSTKGLHIMKYNMYTHFHAHIVVCTYKSMYPYEHILNTHVSTLNIPFINILQNVH